MKNSLFVEFPDERTEFSDENYAAIGRALVFATAFESSCRALSALNYVKMRVGKLSPKTDNDFESVLIQSADVIWDARLRKHISQIIQHFKFPSDVEQVLKKAKAARNEIAHEITLGAAHWIETNDGRKRLLSRLCELTTDIAKGLVIVELTSLVVTHEEIPDATFLSQYTELMGCWICDI